MRALAIDALASRLDPVDAAVAGIFDLRDAAVVALLVPGGDADPAPRLLLIERSAALRIHAGQVAFPGGKPEPGDADLLATACREAREEVGLDVEPRIVGRLHPVPTPSGFLIHPFVGWAPAGWTPRITSPEVTRIVTPTLAQLADPAVHRVTGRGVWRGYRYEMHEYAVHDPPIWGATARMVWDLLRRLQP
jgi:8-oxo-dGTP pyrophosphatase MutT (NUDIX family)